MDKLRMLNNECPMFHKGETEISRPFTSAESLLSEKEIQKLSENVPATALVNMCWSLLQSRLSTTVKHWKQGWLLHAGICLLLRKAYPQLPLSIQKLN